MNKTLIAVLVCAVLAMTASAAVVDLTPANFDEVIKGNTYAFVEFFAPWCGHCKNLAPEYEKFGAAFEGKKDVVIAKVDADAHKELGSRFGVTGFPTLKFFTNGEPEDYKGGRTLEDLISFVNGKVPVTSRAKVPAAAPSLVTVLTPDNFDSIVLDESKDVLVEFYAPWCGHCKRLAPIWDELATVFRGESDLVIAKVDADAHKDLGSRFGVTGFPTIKYFPKGNKAGQDFDGGRELKDLVSWINTNANKFRLPTGRFLETVGVIDALTEVGRKVVAGDEGALDEASKIIAGITDKAQAGFAKLYKKFLETVHKDKDYITTETARLTRMLAGALSPKKTDEFTVRLNILRSLLPGAEDKEEL